MSGLSVIDPDHKMLEDDEMHFHMATVCTSLQARPKIYKCSRTCAASWSHCQPAPEMLPHTTVPCAFSMVREGGK